MVTSPQPSESPQVEDPYLKAHFEKIQKFHDARSATSGQAIFGSFRKMFTALVATHLKDSDRVLDIGCGSGELLAIAGTKDSLGIDIDERAISIASRTAGGKRFLAMPAESLDSLPEECFDALVLSGVLEQVYDIHTVLQRIRRFCAPSSRIVIASYSKISQPALRLVEILGIRDRCPVENWVPPAEIRNLLEQNGYEAIEEKQFILLPIKVPFISTVVNRWLAPLPILRQFCLVNIITARLRLPEQLKVAPSVSVVIAARNEKGNIGPLLDRIPSMAPVQEVIFVEGGSQDETFEEILDQKRQREANGYPSKIVALQQTGKGKADAVRAGFEVATGDILIILDADISVPPEELPRFIELLTTGGCEFANGSRLVYPMEQEAMRFLNLLGNRFFGSLFTYLLGQPVRDTLCGTKALWASDYQRIVDGRSYFGDFDPFGDFDLLFGAARLGLKICDVPVHYKERTYGSTNISRFRHGLLLLKMSAIAARRLKFR